MFRCLSDVSSAPTTQAFPPGEPKRSKTARNQSGEDDVKPIPNEFRPTAKAAHDYTKWPEVKSLFRPRSDAAPRARATTPKTPKEKNDPLSPYRGRDLDTFPRPRTASSSFAGSDAGRPATFAPELLWRIMSSNEARSPLRDRHVPFH